ncbi:hypothetical protein [Salibacterium lacus]|uniref:DUF4139 domain-containing protein n=1 Tax=Salibacterium lacus TaxID=1898109 RepID=A0ABW5T4Z2_9BACI
MENQSKYYTLSGDRFVVNIPFSYPTESDFNPENIEDVNLNYNNNNSVVEMDSMEIGENPSDNPNVQRGAFLFYFNGLNEGETDVKSLEMDLSEASLKFNLKNIEIENIGSSKSDATALMQGGGVNFQSEPIQFQFKNTSKKSVEIKNILANHPDISYATSDITILDNKGNKYSVDDEYKIEPSESVQVKVDWTIDMPNKNKNLEIRPLLILKNNSDQKEYVPLHNMVYRYDENYSPNP